MDDRMDRSAVMSRSLVCHRRVREPKLQADRTALVDDADEWSQPPGHVASSWRTGRMWLMPRARSSLSSMRVNLVSMSRLMSETSDFRGIRLGDVEFVGREFDQRLLALGVGQDDRRA